MALDEGIFNDLRNYLKRRIVFMRYKTETTYERIPIVSCEILNDGTVRVTADIVPKTTPAKIKRVEVYNGNGTLIAHQDTDITISEGQTGVLYWFDFIIRKEGVSCTTDPTGRIMS